MKNTQAQSTANGPPDIDFTTLPVLEMASALRLIAQTLLVNLLNTEQPPDKPPPVRLKLGQKLASTIRTVGRIAPTRWLNSQAQLNWLPASLRERTHRLTRTLKPLGQKMFTLLLHGQGQPDWPAPLLLKQTKLLKQLHKWEAGCRWQRYKALPLLKWAFPLSSLEDTVIQAIAGKLSTRKSHANIVDQILLRFGDNSPLSIPDTLWQLAGEIAWRDPHFQAKTGVLVKDYFRERVLFTKDNMPIAILSPNTYWFLIALTQKGGLFTRPQLNQDRRLVSRIIQQMQHVGQEQAMSSDWAGWWDQWVISEAYRRWPGAFKTLDPELKQVLTTLPLLATSGAGALAQNNAGQQGKTPPALTRQAKLNWKNDEPPWFHHYQSYESWGNKNV